MSETTVGSNHQVGTNGEDVERRIRALEKGIQRWRCLTAVGFLTAMGAFWVAVFGLSQLENTYFRGEMAATLHLTAPATQLEGVPVSDPAARATPGPSARSAHKGTLPHGALKAVPGEETP